jgi:acetyl esterase/lipase/Tol biopolymer transport system component
MSPAKPAAATAAPYTCVLAALLGALALPAAAQNPPAPTHREVGALLYEDIPPMDAQLAARLERYLHTRAATFLDWTADGSLLVKTRFAESEQLHRVASAGAAREQLTFYPDPIEWARGAKSGGGIVFWKDNAGEDNYQIFYRAPQGEIRALTSGDFIHGSPVWAHDGKRVAFYGNERDTLSYDVYVADVTSGAAPQLLVGGKQDTWYPLDWSADDSKLLVWRYLSAGESYLYLADTASGALTPLESKPASGGIRRAKFGPDGRGVYVLTDEDGEFAAVKFKDPITHQSRRVTPEALWDVEDFDVSPDGRYLAYVMNEDGRSRLTVLDLTSRLELAAPGLPEGHIGNVRFDATGTRLALSAESATTPRDAYVFELAQNKIERWTKSELGPLDAAGLITPELVKYPTWDRLNGHPRLLSAWVYRPANPAGPTPVLIHIHGGPEAQARPDFDPFVQFLVHELGYTVIEPNVRGSSGYGKSFLALDNGELREDALRDIGSLLVWIGVQPGFDREHVAVMGGSYGGYLTLAALVSYGERLRGGMAVSGISDFVSFLRNTAPYRRDLRRAEYGDERDTHMRVFLERISPLTNAARIRAPLLVVAGLNDARVPASESDALVWRIRSAGGQVWYLRARDEGHDFRRKADRDAYLEVAASFLAKLAH